MIYFVKEGIMTKCLGCGALMQCEDKNKEGYTRSLDNKFCERCFQIKHYNKYSFIDADGKRFLENVKEIEKTGDLVLLVTDFLNLDNISKFKIKNPVILVITKRDIMPKSFYEERFLNSIKCDLNVVGKILVSAKNNYNLDALLEMINKYKRSKNVYVAGFTNAGKSSLINKFLKNYGNKAEEITTSILPSTTIDLNYISIMDDLVLIDTPGLIDEGSIYNLVSGDELGRIIPRREIRPIIYQIKSLQTVVIDKYASLYLDDNNITIYMSNDLQINRFYKERVIYNFKYYDIDVLEGSDLVIKGLGFIRFKKSGKVRLGLPRGVLYTFRK